MAFAIHRNGTTHGWCNQVLATYTIQ